VVGEGATPSPCILPSAARVLAAPSLAEVKPNPLDTAKRLRNRGSNKKETRDAGQPTRDDHISRATLPRPHQDRCSARGSRPAVYSNHRLAAWLDENCGADGWAMTPSGTRGVLNDARSIYFAEATLASAFVARWCVTAKVERIGGVFRVREDEPQPWVGVGLHKTP